MHCLRHLAILSVLVPFPSTSPYVLLLVAMVAYMAVRPCGYCLATLVIVFFSTSPSSPFLAALSPDPTSSPSPSPNTAAAAAAAAAAAPLSSPIPDRGAFFLNAGWIFDPALEGYRAMQRVWDKPTCTSASQYPPTPPALPLPKWYHDLRVGGVGLVLDFGWRRTEEGLRWELAQHKRAAEIAGYRAAERAGGMGSGGEREEERQRRQGEPTVSGSGGGAWMRSPFVGSW
ncbi:hypothetical protein CC85DRAFT_312283 [Cutaneotrichosporon oleaginosum]|uniref:Uncharacterized protein n=1 Tax=Cutaneotrichosporon oleaginosum TaxID=879819 RepID=A0A0J0XMI7_9TREE|nr:uncharacterized protein CC85DRAFT_312283 [Cutaneotrichosporon oleaginosum]KLT42365.1 hypothetical protein CC85DRAFT_312283 [Cutaneotrichosporon oleaginosum]TXT04185.1 hypothetical protein COLE_07882 [Cutaneotrichosporon oleaginosum]